MILSAATSSATDGTGNSDASRGIARKIQEVNMETQPGNLTGLPELCRGPIPGINLRMA